MSHTEVKNKLEIRTVDAAISITSVTVYIQFYSKLHNEKLLLVFKFFSVFSFLDKKRVCSLLYTLCNTQNKLAYSNRPLTITKNFDELNSTQ